MFTNLEGFQGLSRKLCFRRCSHRTFQPTTPYRKHALRNGVHNNSKFLCRGGQKKTVRKQVTHAGRRRSANFICHVRAPPARLFFLLRKFDFAKHSIIKYFRHYEEISRLLSPNKILFFHGD
jgi:hypothetical protein